MGGSPTIPRRTVLDAVRTPLILAYVSENRGALIEQLVDDAIFRGLFQILKRMLAVG